MNQTTPRPRASQSGLNAAVAATLNGERVALGLTFDELAERAGIPSRSLKRYLSSMERDITIGVLNRLAVALDIPVNEIMRSALRRNAPADPPSATKETG